MRSSRLTKCDREIVAYKRNSALVSLTHKIYTRKVSKPLVSFLLVVFISHGDKGQCAREMTKVYNITVTS